ncbi:MAG: lactate racemase domain-containing protein [Planctomycetota bacterium]|jgi:nickel-dependent lactate racemase
MWHSSTLAEVTEVAATISPDRLLYRIGPGVAPRPREWIDEVNAALQDPISETPLMDLVCMNDRIVVLADDLTRPTPQKEILPVLLEHLNAGGVRDENIVVIVALGTHRYMTEAEMHARFGEEVCARVHVVNHAWQDPDTFVDLGVTELGTPVKVNRTAHEADLLIGTGSIVPHIYAGWAGGAKIVQPGICGPETTARTHCMAAEGDDLLGIPGRTDNPVRQEMERVAAMAGLEFVLNVVVDLKGGPAWVGAGGPVETHRRGVPAAEAMYVQGIPERADVVLADARPATKDYWQGIKALAHAQRGVKTGGTVILIGDFPEGIAPTHPEFGAHALKPYEAILQACEADEIGDRIASATLRVHALIMARCNVTCVSAGMGVPDKEKLGFRHAATAQEALELAMAEHGGNAHIGIVEFSGDVLPAVAEP